MTIYAKVKDRLTALQGIVIFVWLLLDDSIKTIKLLCKFPFDR